ncbi:MAG: hypothetical protein E5W65_24410 [Mesorhizobium sp.]|uniref:hypothetical protein n=1 Tax=Mesorhizobium sp. TaxID=1871066 RepID=UPI001211A40F|nr:hypothetical protein [Mesorhizobium sp.]TIT32637.1 MAG: hypothetical protein E5W65_24410 [Mesorhizobium sp.]
MTIIEFYKNEPIDNWDVQIVGGRGYAYKVGPENLADRKVVRVAVSLSSKVAEEQTLLAMMQVIMLYSLSTVAFHGFHD